MDADRETCPCCGSELRRCPFCEELVSHYRLPQHLAGCDDASGAREPARGAREAADDDGTRERRKTSDADDGGLTTS